jgi:hypothetical protein
MLYANGDLSGTRLNQCPPGIWKGLFNVKVLEDARTAGGKCDLVQLGFQGGLHRASKGRAAVAGRVPYVQNDIGNGHVAELAERRRHGSGSFQGTVPGKSIGTILWRISYIRSRRHMAELKKEKSSWIVGTNRSLGGKAKYLN